MWSCKYFVGSFVVFVIVWNDMLKNDDFFFFLICEFDSVGSKVYYFFIVWKKESEICVFVYEYRFLK